MRLWSETAPSVECLSCGERQVYLDDVLLGLGHELVLELLGHLWVEELSEGSLYGQGSLSVPLLDLVTELVPVVELLDLVIIGLVAIPEGEATDPWSTPTACKQTGVQEAGEVNQPGSLLPFDP